jgi:RNA polymerase sigma-70 factor (ECF subfamily)
VLERSLLGRARTVDVPGPTGELWLLVSVLPDRQRQAVLLRHVGQLTEVEIAAVMRVARGTVSATLRSAYRTLGVALQDQDEDQDVDKELDRERSR